MLLYRVFFFQAEDGIRDHCVTGVQTCALPILVHALISRSARCASCSACSASTETKACTTGSTRSIRSRQARRSEERRVGKECRSQCSPDHRKNNYVTWQRGPLVDGDVPSFHAH